jgi:predicted nucleic acid-binding protein
MKWGLDTSFIMRLLTGDPPDQSQAAAAWLVELRSRGERPLVSDLVVAETYFALQSSYQVPKAEAIAALRDFLNSGDVEAAGAAAEVLRTPGLATVKPGLVDRLIHGAYADQQASLITFEKAAGKLPKARVLS